MRFEDKIRFLAMVFPLSVTSWIRSRKRNVEVGGAANSFHLLGLAVDVVLDNGIEKPAFIQSAVNLGLHVIDETDHLHVMEKRQ